MGTDKPKWWVPFLFAVGFYVLSLLDSKFFPIWVQGSAGVLAVASILVGVFAGCWHYRERLGLVATVMISLLAGSVGLITATHIARRALIEIRQPTRASGAPKTLSAADLSITLIPEKVNGSDLAAHFLVANKSSSPAEILAIRYRVKGVFAHLHESEEPGMIQPGGFRKIPIERGNGLMVSPSITLEYSYKFGENRGSAPGFAVFDIPENVILNQPIVPTFCCEKVGPDIVDKHYDEASKVFAQNDGAIRIADFPEADSNGQPTFIVRSNSKRLLTIDAGTKEVVFVCWQEGVQRVFTSRLRSTIDNLHTVEAYWNDKRKEMLLLVDGQQAKQLNLKAEIRW